MKQILSIHLNIKMLFVFLIMIFIAGCEAKLDLTGIDETLDLPIRRTDQLMSILQLNDSKQYIFGNNGLFLSRVNNDSDWSRQQLTFNNIPPNFLDSTICDDSILVALAYEGNIWISSDAGESWIIESVPTQEELQAIECTSQGDLWVVGSFSTLLSSKDLGKNWQSMTMDEDSMLTEINFVSADTGFAVGEFGLLLRTKDGGMNWDYLNPIGGDFYPLAAYFENEQNGWVGGLQGVILQTIDGGENWTRQSVASDVPIYNFIKNGDLYATGDRGTVLKKTDDSWTKLAIKEIPTYYRSGIVLNNGNLLLAGGWGVLMPIEIEHESKAGE